LFPSPGNTTNNNSIYSSGMNSNLLNSYINEPQGDSNYVNSGMTMPSSYINEPQGDSNYVNSGMTASPSYIDESAIGNSQQFFPSEQANFENANNIYNPTNNNNVIKNPNQETQPYKGIYVDPRTVPEIDLVESNVTYPPSFPAGYGDGNNMSLLTTTDEPYDDRLIMSAPMTVEEQAMGTNPELFEEDENLFNAVSNGQLMDVGDIIYTSSPNTSGNFGGSPDNPGFDELIMSGINATKDGYKYMTNLFSGDEPSAEEVAASVTEEPSIWNSVMEVIAGSAGMGFPGESEPVVAQAEPVVPAIQPSQDMYQYDGAYASNEGSNAAIDAVVANSMAQDQAVAQASQASYTGPSIFTKPPAPAPVYAAPGGPPNRPSKVPSYTWKPSYAGGSGGF
jgi:hypothetical protein